MSRRVIKATECHVCKKNGENFQVCGSHNFRDTKGRISCDRFLKKMRENCCKKCYQVGHFEDKCTSKKLVNSSNTFKVKVIKFDKVPTVVTQNVFSSFAEEDVVDIPKKSAKTSDWATWSDDEESSPRIRIRARSPSPF
jgi:hypothetical protein